MYIINLKENRYIPIELARNIKKQEAKNIKRGTKPLLYSCNRCSEAIS